MKLGFQKGFNLLLGLLMLGGFILLGYHIPREDFNNLFLLFLVQFGLMVAYFIQNKSKGTWVEIFVLGLLCRLILMISIPSWSDDYARFLWDGELLQMGQNPYQETPAEWLIAHKDAESSYMKSLFGAMNSPSYYSVYPPLDQLIFWIAASSANERILSGIVILRGLLLAGELSVFFLLLRLFRRLQIPVRRLCFYWLNPLVIMEITGNLHFEGLVLLFLLASLLAVGKNKLVVAGGTWGMAIGLKLLPLILFPSLLLFKKTRVSILFWAGTFLVLLLSFAWLIVDNSWINFLRSLRLYQGKFEFNASIYYLMREVGFWIKGYNTIATLTQLLSAVVLIGVCYASWKLKPKNFPELVDLWVLIYLIYLILQPAVHPWYIIPGVGLSLLAKRKTFVVWTFSILFSYEAYSSVNYDENPFLLAVEYLVVLAAILWDYFPRRTTDISAPLSSKKCSYFTGKDY